jgi:hypothetical protein
MLVTLTMCVGESYARFGGFRHDPQPQSNGLNGVRVASSNVAHAVGEEGRVSKSGTVTMPAVDTATHHYEYVFVPGWIYVYDIDNGHAFVKTISVPTTAGPRGQAVSPSDGMLYISYGGDGGKYGNGSMLQYNLIRDSIGWVKNYSHGIDSHAITPDGKTIYMPDGELSLDGKWYIVNASDGSETGVITTNGHGPHNTCVNLSGTRVYMGERNPNNVGNDSFYVASTSTNQVTKSVGRMQNGVRPFTINGAETFAFVTITEMLGFQVCDLTARTVPYTIDLTTMGFPKSTCTGSTCQTIPSHGISLSPDEREIYVVDNANSYIHVFDVSRIAQHVAPVKVADIKLQNLFVGSDSGCVYDCVKSGWVHHSLDGRYVYVGQSGDVISTATRTIVANLPALKNSREMLEIDWKNGVPVATSTRTGLGYITTPSPPSAPGLLAPPNGGSNALPSLTLTWHPSALAFAYRIQVATDSLFGSLFLEDSTLTTTSRLVSGLATNTVYYWRVRAKNIYGWSAFSARWYFSTGSILPIQLASLTGELSNGNNVVLRWTTISEINNYGFYVERRKEGATSFDSLNAFIPGAGTTLEAQHYSWTDQHVEPGTYDYRLVQVDLDGLENYSPVISVSVSRLTGVGDAPMPKEFSLMQNQPNPFNPSTIIRYALPSQSNIRLEIFDVLGQRVALVADGRQELGYHEQPWNASSVASGMYFYRLEAASISDPGKSFTQVRKMLLLK